MQSKMAYTTEAKVYKRTGFSSELIQSTLDIDVTEVSTRITALIADAQAQIRKDIRYPIRIKKELHLGDGYSNKWTLGPADDPYAEEGDYDPENGLVEVQPFEGLKPSQGFPRMVK